MSAQTQDEKDAAKAAAAKEKADKAATEQAAQQAAAEQAAAEAKAAKPGRTWTSERDPETGIVTAKLK